MIIGVPERHPIQRGGVILHVSAAQRRAFRRVSTALSTDAGCVVTSAFRSLKKLSLLLRAQTVARSPPGVRKRRSHSPGRMSISPRPARGEMLRLPCISLAVRDEDAALPCVFPLPFVAIKTVPLPCGP